MQIRKTELNRFDQIKLLTTKNIQYMSAPEGHVADPHGIWTIAGIIHVDADTYEVLATKQQTVVRVPVTDILLVKKHNPRELITKFRDVLHGQIAQAAESRKQASRRRSKRSAGTNRESTREGVDYGRPEDVHPGRIVSD